MRLKLELMSINFLKRKSAEISPDFSEENPSEQARYVNYSKSSRQDGSYSEEEQVPYGADEKEYDLNNMSEYPNTANDFEEEFQSADDSSAQTTTPEDSPEADTGGQAFDVMTETVYKKATRWVLLIGVALMPLFFLPWTTEVLELNKQLLLTVVAGTGLVLWLLDVVMSGKISWRFNPLDKGVVALAGAVALSAVFSVTKLKSVFGMANSLSDSLLVVVGLTLIYLLIVNSFDDKGKLLKYLFSASVVVAVIYGLLQMLGIYILSIFDFTVSRAFNTIGSINTLGMIAAVVLPILYTNKPDNRILGYIFKIGTLATLVVLIIINWWILWIVAIAGMIAVVTLESLNTSELKSLKMSRFLFPMTVTVLGIFLIVVGLNLVFVKNNLPVEIAPSHKLSGSIAWGVLQDNFAFGYGPENFSLAFDKYGAGELRNTTLSGIKLSDSASHVLNMAVHNGLVGLATFGFVLWLLVWPLFKVTRSGLADLNRENIGVVSAMLAIAIATFLYPFNFVLVLIFYLLLALTVLVAWGNQRVVYNVEEKASLSLVSSLGFIGGLVVALVGLYFVSLNYVADIKYAKALNQTEPQKALDYTIEAINWKGNDDRFYRLSSQLALTLLSQELNTQATQGDDQKNNRVQNYLSSAVALAQRATQVAPNEANNWVNLGNVYQNLIQLVEGVDALAETAYLRASELRPGDPSFHNRIGRMYLLMADLLRRQSDNQQANAALLKAEDAFKQAIELSSNFGLAIYNLGSVYERQGKLDEAIKQLETVAPFNTNQPGLAFELGLLYYRANQKDKALNELQRAVLLSHDFANARWYLGLIYEERSDFDSAIEQMEKILSVEANKENSEVLQKLEQLKSGQKAIPPQSVIDQEPL